MNQQEFFSPENSQYSSKGNRTTPIPALSQTVYSRDEMNLAEFPLTVLSTRVDSSLKTLEFSDFQKTKDGELVERKWIITGADKFGLPTSTDDDVILGLIRLTMDDGFRDRKVYFTRYELLKTLRWSTEGRSYTRLTKALDRLSGVRIRASNAFYDNSSKSYQTVNFGIVDAYEINDTRASKKRRAGDTSQKSFFIWSEMLFDSFRSGFIKKLDLDLYLSLKSAVSRRLYRYLDKHFYFKSTIERPLMQLAFEKLGLSRNYKYVSSVRQQIEPAADELKAIGFLSGYEIFGKGELTSIRFQAGNQVMASSSVSANSKNQTAAPILSGKTLKNSQLIGESQLVEALVSRGISVMQAKRLIAGNVAPDYSLIDRIIQYYDFLVEKNDIKVSKNKVGFLYRAVESPHRFNVPASFGRSASNKFPNRGGRPELRPFNENQSSAAALHSVAPPDNFNKLQISSDLLSVDEQENLKQSLRAAVEKKYAAMKNSISEAQYKNVVETTVKQQLDRLFSK